MTYDHHHSAVKFAAMLAHEANRAYCNSIGDHSQPLWRDAPDWQRDSAIAGVVQIANNPETTPEQSHEGWCKQKVADGWVYGETKDPEKKTHHCLVPYAQLPEAQRIKDTIYGAVVRGALSAHGQEP